MKRTFENYGFTFYPTGWLDISDTLYWQQEHIGWFKVFGEDEEGVFVECEFSPARQHHNDKATCSLHNTETMKPESISLSASLPKQRFDQIYSIFARAMGDFKHIDISVACKTSEVGPEYDDGTQDVEMEVIEIRVESHHGPYFTK